MGVEKGKTYQHLLPRLLPPDIVTVYLTALTGDNLHVNDRTVTVRGDLLLDYLHVSSPL